jgi:hypothetical protein
VSQCTPLSLQLLLQLVQEAPLRALSDDLLGGALDHPCFVQAERIKTDRVFGIVLAPPLCSAKISFTARKLSFGKVFAECLSYAHH